MQRSLFAGNRLGGPGMPGQFRAGGQMPGFPGRAGATAGRGGGFLSRLFQRGGQTAAANPAAAFQRGAAGGGGSLFKSITNPSSISSFLNNTQNVLKTAQQVGPMIQQIQQVGPLVKNLPAMWKLYRGLKNAPEEEGQENRELSSKEKNLNRQKRKKATGRRVVTHHLNPQKAQMAKNARKKGLPCRNCLFKAPKPFVPACRRFFLWPATIRPPARQKFAPACRRFFLLKAGTGPCVSILPGKRALFQARPAVQKYVLYSLPHSDIIQM
ncbi:YqfQ family protein [Heyndrickxia coagulans]|nr:YqfQ family protein [Heyndrickxia coagulans]